MQIASVNSPENAEAVYEILWRVIDFPMKGLGIESVDQRTGQVTKKILIMVFSVLMFLAGTAAAARFDMWETGMDINEVVALARKHNIPITRSGVYHSYKGFEQKLVDDKFFKAPVLEYQTRIGELGSKIYLKLSDQPRQVYEIEVGIYGIKDREQFLEEMLGILKQKYGPYRERKEIVYHYLEWNPDKTSQITLRVSSGQASVFYTDPRMKQVVEAKKKEKEIDAIRKDGKKF
jgi:hypothetical protein